MVAGGRQNRRGGAGGALASGFGPGTSSASTAIFEILRFFAGVGLVGC